MEAEQNSLNNKLEGWKHKVQVTVVTEVYPNLLSGFHPVPVPLVFSDRIRLKCWLSEGLNIYFDFRYEHLCKMGAIFENT